jgi:hypothetical protein
MGDAVGVRSEVHVDPAFGYPQTLGSKWKLDWVVEPANTVSNGYESVAFIVLLPYTLKER